MLEREKIKQFLDDMGAGAASIRSLMESEDWVLDQSDEEIEALVIEIGKQIADANPSQFASTLHDDWIVMLSLISLPRFLLTLKHMENSIPSIVSAMIEYGQKKINEGAENLRPHINVTQSRIENVYKQDLYCRVFNPRRVAVLEQLLEQRVKAEEI